MVFLCTIFHTLWSDKNCYASLPFGMLCLSAIRMIFVKILLTVCMSVGIVV